MNNRHEKYPNIIYICTICQAEFDYRCPDEEDCPLSHPCVYCKNEVVVRDKV